MKAYLVKLDSMDESIVVLAETAGAAAAKVEIYSEEADDVPFGECEKIELISSVGLA